MEKLTKSVDQLSSDAREIRVSVEHLDNEIKETRKVQERESAAMRQEYRRRTNSLRIGGAVLAFLLVVTIVASVLNAVKIERTVKKLCPIVGILSNPEPPPSTPKGKQILNDAGGVFAELGC